MGTSRRDQVIESVRRLDRLFQERDRLVTDIDAQILAAEGLLDSLIGEIGGNGMASKPTPSRPEGMSQPTYLMRLLRERPRAPIGWLAVQIYSEDTRTTRTRVRAMLAGLKRRGLIHSPRRAEWEVVPATAGGAP